jgi:Na+/proline symporter
MAIGLLLAIYYGRPEIMGEAAPLDLVTDTKSVYPQFLLNHLPAGLKGLAIAGLFAAAMSSFDSAINAMASTAVADLYIPWRALRHQPGSVEADESRQGPESQHQLRAPRVAVAVMGVLLTGFAILAIFLQSMGDDTLLNFALGVMAFAHAPLLGVFMAAVLTRRGNTTTVITALVVGALAVLMLQSYMLPSWLNFELAWPWWSVIVSPLSFVICVLGKKA